MKPPPHHPPMVLCPGQGAQHVGMGKVWVNRFEVSAQTFAAADEALGMDLSKVCFEGPAEQLDRTDLAQPAIYTTSVACYRALVSTGRLDRLGATAGLSLGEFTALHLAGVFDFLDGLKLVQLRGRAMQQATEGSQNGRGGGIEERGAMSEGERAQGGVCGEVGPEKSELLQATRAGGGATIERLASPCLAPRLSARGPRPLSGMVALVGADEPQALRLCAAALDDPKNPGTEVLVPANFNCPGQVVVSGSAGACLRAVSVAEKMGIRATPLNVAGAFHSPLMKSAADRLAEALGSIDWHEPTVPVLSNVSAEPHDGSDLKAIKQRLIDQLTQPVRWSQSMQWAVQNLSIRLVELAPGKVLTGLMRRIDHRFPVQNFAEP